MVLIRKQGRHATKSCELSECVLRALAGVSKLEMRGFDDTVTSQAYFCLVATSGFNNFDETRNLVLTHS